MQRLCLNPCKNTHEKDYVLYLINYPERDQMATLGKEVTMEGSKYYKG